MYHLKERLTPPIVGSTEELLARLRKRLDLIEDKGAFIVFSPTGQTSHHGRAEIVAPVASCTTLEAAKAAKRLLEL